MNGHSGTIRLGTRGSPLARWQTDYVLGLLRAAWPARAFAVEVFTTRGDQVLDAPLPLVGGKGLFTAELEAALRCGTIDLAVHSLKDLLTESPPGLIIGAIPPREDPHDVLISRQGYTLDKLPSGAVVGTSSVRRAAQLRYRRPDLRLLDIRGNVDTRVRKALAADGLYDAVILARAGLERLGQGDVITQVLPLDQMLPAPGQGALAVQCQDTGAALALLRPINRPETQAAVVAERAFLAGLGGGCAVPIAAYASLAASGHLHLRGRVCAQDGAAQIEVSAAAPVSDSGGFDIDAAARLGLELAQTALARGAAALIGASAQPG